MKIVLTANTAWGLYNFRRSLIGRLLEEGHELLAVAPSGDHRTLLEALGVRFVPMEMDNRGTSPINDAALFLRFRKLFRAEAPDLVISFTVKPVIFAGFAARFCGVPAISVVTGLGSAFLRDNLVTRIVEVLYRFSQRSVEKVFVLNQDDLAVFRKKHLAPVEKLVCINGEGIDLDHFSPAYRARARPEQPFRFLLAARILWDKGVGEFVAAARELRRKHPSVEFCILGFLDAQNPTAISREQMEIWQDEGVVRYLGHTGDIRPQIALADCVVLPSYREGISRVLLEAAAMGLPIVASDVTGCREIVEHEQTGFLCAPQDHIDLAHQMNRMLSLTDDQRAAMGARGRRKVAEEFDESIVVQRYLRAIEEVRAKRSESTT